MGFLSLHSLRDPCSPCSLLSDLPLRAPHTRLSASPSGAHILSEPLLARQTSFPPFFSLMSRKHPRPVSSRRSFLWLYPSHLRKKKKTKCLFSSRRGDVWLAFAPIRQDCVCFFLIASVFGEIGRDAGRPVSRHGVPSTGRIRLGQAASVRHRPPVLKHTLHGACGGYLVASRTFFFLSHKC